jgi:hypothetical protein
MKDGLRTPEGLKPNNAMRRSSTTWGPSALFLFKSERP